MKKTAPFIIVIIFLILGFFLINRLSLTPPKLGGLPAQTGEGSYVKIAGQNIKVELATTVALQTKGLSGRSGLEEGEGMLFVFETGGKFPFWMKDMNFSIDIIWISADKKVIYIKKDARPEDYPQSYGPAENAMYVLEVVSGFSEKNNLKIGDRVEI